ncbi:MAG: RNA methylase [Bdellovibrionaceae bacterium]|nr:RNA methylase [Pseudobdellovibrionaceae bacterium]|tara:strand:- start:34283 stop:35011 length:729 start_codon:yes stop_codon:yes gene_type:complete
MTIEKEKFWRAHRFLSGSAIPVGDTKLSSNQVIQGLSEFITEERKSRIDEVLKGRTRSIIPVMENIYDRGNISAAMRSAEAYGFFEFHIIESEDARFKSANRVTQGADKWLDVREYGRTATCIKDLKQRGYKIYATDLKSSVPISDIDFTEPSAIIFGNEKEGISAEATELADQNIILPMTGFSQSFNISVAAALSFYHIWLARNQTQGHSGDLSTEQFEELKAYYYYKAVKNPEQLLNTLK